MTKRRAACWFLGCEEPGRPGRVVYMERGGEIPLTLCDEHGRGVQAALADPRQRGGVLVTSHEPSRVLIEEPRRPATGKYRATFVSTEGMWPVLELRRSLHSPHARAYLPPKPDLFISAYEEGVHYSLLEVSAEEEVDDSAWDDGPRASLLWPKSALVERVLGGYTDRQAYLPRPPTSWPF